MLELNFFLIAFVVVAWAVTKAIREAPEGCQDGAGFHLRKQG
jgi:hypothetical protein